MNKKTVVINEDLNNEKLISLFSSEFLKDDNKWNEIYEDDKDDFIHQKASEMGIRYSEADRLINEENVQLASEYELEDSKKSRKRTNIHSPENQKKITDWFNYYLNN